MKGKGKDLTQGERQWQAGVDRATEADGKIDR